ncbi:hypothetical protein ACET3Z_019142 [Daucus carota]
MIDNSDGDVSLLTRRFVMPRPKICRALRCVLSVLFSRASSSLITELMIVVMASFCYLMALVIVSFFGILRFGSVGNFLVLSPTRVESIRLRKVLCYDSISDAYKFFRIVCEKMYDKVPIVQVYSTSTDSWREFRDPILKNYENFDRRNVVVNGVLYFDGVDELISFDLHNEVFGQVPFPSWVTRKGSDVLDFEGSVAMVFQSGPEIHLWTLGDVSGQMSWTKKFSIEADSETEIWLTSYLGAGQFFGKKLFNEDYFMFSLLYDYRKKEYKFYKRRDENIWAYLKYTETLVSLDDFEHVDLNTNNISLTGERRA